MESRILLQALVEENLLKPEDANRLVQEAATTQKSVEEIIYESRLADETKVAKVKGEILNVPYKKVLVEKIDPELLKSIPAETAQTYKVIPLSKTEDMLVVGMLNPDDQKAQDALRFVAKQLKTDLGIYLITPSDLDAILKKYSPFKDEIQAAVRALGLKGGGKVEKAIQLEETAAVVEEAPIIKIVASTLKEAVSVGASDIHIEPQRTRLRIRFRIAGDLQETSEMPPELYQPIVSRIKVLSKLRLDETRVPQDGRFRSIVFGKDIDFRVATFPTPAGEKVAIRVLDPTTGLRSLGDLGFSERNQEIAKEAINKPFGTVFITGPTGSGKSTTLYALLQILNSPDINIVSLEDPVEYYVDGTNQSQVRPEIGYDFAAGLRQILRQDPDVIMVGEVRDVETAGLSIHAALTGHVVLTTLHTNNVIGVIPRLLDLKVDSFLLPSAVNLMAAQRLVVRLCDKCKKAEAPSPKLLEIIKKEIDKLSPEIRSKLKIKEPYKVYRSPGCPACKNKGITGRMAVSEMLQMTPQLADIISAGPTENKLLEEARRQGMVTMRQDGILKALEGFVPIEDVLRETEELE